MFQQITTYLFRYKTVGIPGVGTFQLVQQPARFDAARELLFAPQETAQLLQEVLVSPHQLQTLADEWGSDAEQVQYRLEQIGKSLLQLIHEKPFTWRGVGVLEADGTGIRFQPQTHLLEPVPAERVVRENVQHTVLVGDREMQVVAETPAEAVPDAYPFEEPRKRPWVLILGWTAVLLALAFLIYHLYTQRWSPAASGSQQKIKVQTQRPLYQ